MGDGTSYNNRDFDLSRAIFPKIESETENILQTQMKVNYVKQSILEISFSNMKMLLF